MKKSFLFATLSILCILLFILDILFGSIYIPVEEIINSLSSNSVYKEIIFNIRIPKAITAILVGSSLSVSGLLMQTLFRNPLAGPYVLGVSSGASLGVAVLLLSPALLIPVSFATSGWTQILFATIGACSILLLVILVSLKISDTVSLLIVGMMFGSISGALVNVLQSISNPEAIKSFVVWSFGSLSSVTWEHLKIISPVVFIGLLVSFFLQKNLDALLLGENYAKGLGIPIFKTRLFIILATSLLAGSTTAFTGPIAFIGITVPHIARGLFGTAIHRVIIIACTLCGSAILLLCDIVSQLPGTGYTLPINSICALVGAPIIIWIIFRNKNVRS